MQERLHQIASEIIAEAFITGGKPRRLDVMRWENELVATMEASIDTLAREAELRSEIGHLQKAISRMKTSRDKLHQELIILRKEKANLKAYCAPRRDPDAPTTHKDIII